MNNSEYTELKKAMRNYEKKVFEAREELDEIINEMFLREDGYHKCDDRGMIKTGEYSAKSCYCGKYNRVMKEKTGWPA